MALSASLLGTLAVGTDLASGQTGTPIGFLETFALAEDRGAVLDQLVSGTEEHDYFSSLHLQQQGDFDAVDRILKTWRTRSGETSGYRQIEARQALLRASSDPAATYKFIEEELGLSYNHKRRIAGQAPDLPSQLDGDLIDTEKLLAKQLRRGSNGIGELSPRLLERLVGTSLSKSQRAKLLDRLPRADVPGLIDVVLADFEAEEKLTFGGRQIHSRMTLAQLEQLRGARPAVLSNQNYVDAVMRRLALGSDESIESAEDREAYIQRTWNFVTTLPSSFNSLKAHVLFRWLESDLKRGAVNRDRVERYLRLPRSVWYMVHRKNDGRTVADLSADFSQASPFDAIGDESEVVIDSLYAIFKDAASYEPMLGVLKEDFAQRVFAEAKLLYGDASKADEFIEMLGGAAAAEALRDRVEIDFVRENRQVYGATEAVTLDVEIKNVDSLIVKIFEVDPVAVFDRFGSLRIATLDVDGLVPNTEMTFDYAQAPLTRHRERFGIEELSGAGTYLVEMIGGGVSSRAVVRKGSLHLLARVGSAGHVFRVLGADRTLAQDAVLRFGARDYTPDENGEIFVPFTTAPSQKTVLLRTGDAGAASIATFDHLPETYALEAAIHAPTEALLAGMEATFTVRPRLSVAGERIPLDLLEDPVLVITSTDRDGNQSTKIADGLELNDAGEISETIRVPERTQMFDVVLRGNIRSMSEETEVSLTSASASFPVNRIEFMATTQALLTKAPGGYVIEMRGRNGELRKDIDVTVTMDHSDFDDAVNVLLKSDADGRIALGPLPQIRSVAVSGSNGVSNSWSIMGSDIFGLPDALHGAVGEDLRVPYAGLTEQVQRGVVSLIETRRGVPLRDAFENLLIEDRYVVLRGLRAGEYELTLEETGEAIHVSVIEGKTIFGHVVGERRALSQSDPVPLQITSAGKEGEALVVRLGGVTPATRVQVVATKYVDPLDAASGLALASRDLIRSSALVDPRTTFESGRKISDEYRYILDRRTVVAYPGNMLTRPGYLLNPWVVNDTNDSMMDDGDAGGAYRGLEESAGAPARRSRRPSAKKVRGRQGERAHNRALDFLQFPASVLSGLKPDENGIVRIPLDAIGPNHMIRIVAIDNTATAALDITGTPLPVNLRDRRLLDPIDPATSMTQQRRIAFVDAGEAIEIRDAASAGAKSFDTLGDVFLLYRTMSGEDSELAKFEFLTRWPSLTDEERLENYSTFVCHELNAFLREKDPEFFRAIVVPYIANKGHRTFMDDWLLGADLAMYLEPWCFEKLNVVEKILLLQGSGGDAGRVAKDLLALAPRGTFSLDSSFGQILATGGLDNSNEPLGEAMKEMRRDAARSLRRQASASPAPLEAPAMASADVFFVSSKSEAAPDQQLAGLEELELEDSPEHHLGLELDQSADLGRRMNATGFFFRDLADTKELAETHYWRTRLNAMQGDLITASPFWVDFAEAGGERFVSSSFSLATRNTTEMLLALAFLDLPFESAEHGVEVEGRGVRMTAASPMYLALEDIRSAAPKEGSPEVLVGQDFFLPEQRTTVVDGVERERYVAGEFLTGRPYGCRVVVTNPSSSSIDLQVLLQIPEGAIPLENSFATKGIPVVIGPYGTQAREMLFYFPEPGTFIDYPVHAGKDDVLLGAADAVTLTVVDELTTEDTDSWEWISQNADLPSLLNYLGQSNPRTIDLSQIAWRMSDRASFDAIRVELSRRNVFHPTLWQYAVKHRASDATAEYLGMNGEMLSRVGESFTSPLLTVEPRKRASYEHLAYEPLVNGRTFAFGGERRILNNEFAAQYMGFLRTLTLQPQISDEERMELSYYLLLQDRTGEALAAFDRIDRGRIPTQVQYDYMSAYMAFFRGEVAEARSLAESYADHPVERWRSRFQNVLAQADEIEGRGPGDVVDEDDRNQTQGARAGNEPVLGVSIEDGRVVVDYERIGEIEVRYHRMDIEFLFSNSPFVRGDEGAFGLVQPNLSERIALGADGARHTFDLPAGFEAANVIVEVRGAGLAKRATYFAGDLVVQGMERYGQVKIIDGGTRKALPKTYVKVYAKLANGQVRFHKDGYTDLRGRFDYVSLSGVEGPEVERYAVLVMNEGAGAKIEELSPPSR